MSSCGHVVEVEGTTAKAVLCTVTGVLCLPVDRLRSAL